MKNRIDFDHQYDEDIEYDDEFEGVWTPIDADPLMKLEKRLEWIENIGKAASSATFCCFIIAVIFYKNLLIWAALILLLLLTFRLAWASVFLEREIKEINDK